MSPLLANLTPRRARTEHRRALIWSDFKTGAGAKQDGGPLGGGVFMRAGVVLVLRHFSLSPSLSLSTYLFANMARFVACGEDDDDR